MICNILRSYSWDLLNSFSLHILENVIYSTPYSKSSIKLTIRFAIVGVFLIPYLLTLVLMGVPVFFLELGVGQRLRKGPLHAWNHLAPYFTGIGLASVMVAFLVSSYYNMIIGWCFYYLFISFQKNVPYAKCPVVTDSFGNVTFIEECSKSSPTTYFWYRVVLNSSDSIEDSGVFNWKLCLCLLLAWTVVYLSSFKGTASMGKVWQFSLSSNINLICFKNINFFYFFLDCLLYFSISICGFDYIFYTHGNVERCIYWD